MSEVKNIPSLANQELHFMLFINKKVGVVIGLPLWHTIANVLLLSSFLQNDLISALVNLNKF